MIWRFNFTSYGDQNLLHMENDAAIYPLHFGNSNFCKSNPLFLVYYI